MTTAGKLLTLLIFGAIFLMVVTHAAGFSAATMAGGSVLDSTLAIESGSGTTAGSQGTVTFPNGGSVALAA